MQPPQVQNLDQIIADLNPAYQKQTDLLNQQRSGLGIKYDSQRSALGAEKVQGFNQINNQATSRGLSFSGIPLDEQATYLSTKYLPGMQNLAAQQNQEDMSLQEALAKIDSDRRLRALDVRSGQQSNLERYLAEERNRQFEAEQNALNRAATASQQAQENAAPTANDYLQQAFSSYVRYNPNDKNTASEKDRTEREIIPQLAGALGVSRSEAAKLAYEYRKRNFGEGYGWIK